MKFSKINEALVIFFLVFSSKTFADANVLTKFQNKIILKKANTASSGTPSKSTEINNIDYIKLARESSISMLIEASAKYKAGSITKEQYIQVALQASQMAEHYNKLIDISDTKSNPISAPAAAAAPATAAAPASTNQNSEIVASTTANIVPPPQLTGADACTAGQIWNGSSCFTCLADWEPSFTKNSCMGTENFCAIASNYNEVRCVIRRREVSQASAEKEPAESSNVVKESDSAVGPFCGVAGDNTGRSTMGRNPNPTRAVALEICMAKYNSKGAEKYAYCKWKGEVIFTAGIIPNYSINICDGF